MKKEYFNHNSTVLGFDCLVFFVSPVFCYALVPNMHTYVSVYVHIMYICMYSMRHKKLYVLYCYYVVA